jgi:hypothetical protein
MLRLPASLLGDARSATRELSRRSVPALRFPQAFFESDPLTDEKAEQKRHGQPNAQHYENDD